MNRRAFIRRTPPTPAQDIASYIRQQRTDDHLHYTRPAPQGQPLNLSAGLAPLPTPLTASQTAHLLRRTGWSAPLDATLSKTGQTAAAVVAEIVAEAVATPLPEPPEWAETLPPPRGDSDEAFDAFAQDNTQWTRDYRGAWLERMHTYGLSERMTLFWHNHFVTGIGTYFLAAFAHRYLTVLRTHALGNVKEFVREIGTDAAMLVYLNGTDNTVGAPNENYARELLELFTMGPTGPDGSPNYTETDIQEIARALTGYTVDFFTMTVDFNPVRHDQGDKTIFGQTGAWGYDDVIDLLFSERGDAMARFICRKVYQAFVYAVADEAIVDELATILLDADWAIAPVLETLLASEHFFDEAVLGAMIKSPVDLIVGLMTEMETPPPDDIFTFLRRGTALCGQTLLNPPNVAGWQGHHAWLSTTTFPTRWFVLDVILFGERETPPLDLLALAALLHDANDPEAAFYLPTALAEHLMAVPAALLDLTETNDAWGGNLDANPIPDDILNGPTHQRILAQMFLGGTPWYEWSLYGDGALARLQGFVRFLLQQPEYQLT